jgi:hypothetical protein
MSIVVTSVVVCGVAGGGAVDLRRSVADAIDFL